MQCSARDRLPLNHPLLKPIQIKFSWQLSTKLGPLPWLFLPPHLSRSFVVTLPQGPVQSRCTYEQRSRP